MAHALSTPAAFDMLRPRAAVGRLALAAGRIVLAMAVGLTVLGFVMLYSWSSVRGLTGHPSGDANFLLATQLQWVFLAALAGWAASAVPLEWLRRVAVPGLATVLVVLAFVLVAGHTSNGATRWIRIAGFSIQPSEVLKLALALYLAERLARREEDVRFGSSPPLGALLAPVGLGAALVLLEPDLGTSLFVVAEAAVLLALAGIRPTRVIPFAVTATPVLLFYAYTRFAHVRERLAGTGVQVHEALVAIGSGGLLGVGLGAGTQKLGFVPEIHTDFVFALIGEELGFLGCAAVLVAFMLFTWFGSRLAWYARVVGPFASYLAAAAVFVVAFQALINVAVVTDVAPTKGIPLPFLSKGGSNLIVVSIAVGLLVNVARRTAAAAGDEPWS